MAIAVSPIKLSLVYVGYLLHIKRLLKKYKCDKHIIDILNFKKYNTYKTDVQLGES